MRRYSVILVFVCLALSCVTAQPIANKTFPVVVEFVSHCCGVPDQQPINSFVSLFKEKYKHKTIRARRIGPIGKEGEYYLAFPLTELDAARVSEFIDGIEKVSMKPGDKGGLIFHRNFMIDSSRLPQTITLKDSTLQL